MDSRRELRPASPLNQEEVADRLSVAQSNLSRLERRRDMLISTLQAVVPTPLAVQERRRLS